MKIKIIKPVVANKAVHRKDAVVDLPEALAKELIAKKFAVEHSEAAAADKQPEAPKQPESAAVTREGLLAAFKDAGKKDLLKTKAEAEKKLAAEPGRLDAKLVLEVVAELLANK